MERSFKDAVLRLGKQCPARDHIYIYLLQRYAEHTIQVERSMSITL